MMRLLLFAWLALISQATIAKSIFFSPAQFIIGVIRCRLFGVLSLKTLNSRCGQGSTHTGLWQSFRFFLYTFFDSPEAWMQFLQMEQRRVINEHKPDRLKN